MSVEKKTQILKILSLSCTGACVILFLIAAFVMELVPGSSPDNYLKGMIAYFRLLVFFPSFIFFCLLGLVLGFLAMRAGPSGSYEARLGLYVNGGLLIAFIIFVIVTGIVSAFTHKPVQDREIKPIPIPSSPVLQSE